MNIDIERYEQIIDEVYKNYYDSHPDAEKTFQYEGNTLEVRRMTKDEFVDMVKTDKEFGREWGLIIEEKELSLEERADIYFELHPDWVMIPENDFFDTHNIPTKVINVYHIPKQSVEFIEITILPTGKNITND